MNAQGASKRGIWIAVLCIPMVLAFSPPAAFGTAACDVNGDNVVNTQDLQACVNHILGEQDWGAAADCNGDGVINVVDVQAVANVILSGLPPPHKAGIWISAEELAARPMSGAAWNGLKAAADQSWGTADIKDQDNKHALKTLAGALVYARTGQSTYRDRVHAAVMAAMGTEEGGRTLALGRSLGAYVIAADLIDMKSHFPGDEQRFRAWLSEVRTKDIGGHGRWFTLTQTHENSANNWGTFAGASRIAASLYLGDGADVARAAEVFRAWLGERGAYPPDAPGADGYFQKTSEYDPSWVCEASSWVAVNPPCEKSGIDLNGALVEDVARGGGLNMPPGPSGMSYSWEALQGVYVQAEFLFRAGYDPYSWSSQALRRALDFMLRAGWNPTNVSTYVPWMANHRYGTSYPTEAASYGRVMGYADWTHP